jgi:hypothetical protein
MKKFKKEIANFSHINRERVVKFSFISSRIFFVDSVLYVTNAVKFAGPSAIKTKALLTIYQIIIISLRKILTHKERFLQCELSRESGEKKTKCDRTAPSHPLRWPCVSDLLATTSKARAATRRNPR